MSLITREVGRVKPEGLRPADGGRIIITPVVPSKFNVRLVSCVFGLTMILLIYTSQSKVICKYIKLVVTKQQRTTP
jgi:hypothetical protein